MKEWNIFGSDCFARAFDTMTEEKQEMKLPRRANEFRNVFGFLDKNGDGSLTKDEMRFIMSAVGHELSEEQLRELITEIAGTGEQST